MSLFLEMSAEASRDPQIAKALRASDHLIRAELQAWLGRGRKDGGRGLRGGEAESRAIAMQCVIEGLAIRAVREPDLHVDKLEPALQQLFDLLLAPSVLSQKFTR